MFKSLATLAACSLALAAAACGSAPSSEVAESSNQAMTSPAADPAFTPCAFDSDCVAVPQAGCCNNGWLVAVNSDLVDDYNTANTCTVHNMMCMQYVVVDTRVAVCDNTSLACQMVAPTSIQCGGTDVNAHSCPAGYGCVLANDGSGLGTCTQGAPSTPTAPCDDAGTITPN
jgi:hypothetical protein